MGAELRYFCHMCRGEVEIGEVAHTDIYVDLCWIQCRACAAASGDRCGMDRSVNPHPHGYLTCPYRLVRSVPRGHLRVVHGDLLGPAGEPNGGKGA